MARWLTPESMRLVIGGALCVVLLILLLAHGTGAKLAGLIVAVGALAVFRQGYHEKAGLQAQTRLPADEATRVAVDVANSRSGPLARIQFNGSTTGRADFTIVGATGKPLHFHMSAVADPIRYTLVSTRLDKWTWRRNRIYLIPVPLTKRIDGYGVYKSFGQQLLKELQRRDQTTTGAFNNRPE